MLVADAGAVDREGLQQRHTGAVHHRKGTGEARQGDAFEDAADNGQAQFDAIPLESTGIGLDPFEEGVKPANDAQQQQPPIIAHEVGRADQHAGGPRQLGVELGEHLGESRDHQQVDHRERDAHGDHDEDGITSRLLDALAGFALQLEIGRQLLKRLVELAGVLANADHTDEQVVEHFGVGVQRYGHGLTALQTGTHVLQDLPEEQVSVRLCQTADSADDRHTGLAQTVHLAAEDDQLIEIDALTPELFAQHRQCITAASLTLAGFDGQRSNLS